MYIIGGQILMYNLVGKQPSDERVLIQDLERARQGDSTSRVVSLVAGGKYG